MVFIPIGVLVLLIVGVYRAHIDSPYGSYGDAWPNLAAVWITLMILLLAGWVLMRSGAPSFARGRGFGLTMFVWAIVTLTMGAVSLFLALNVTGFQSEWHKGLEWFTLSSGLVQFAVIGLAGGTTNESLWGKTGYAFGMGLGITMMFIAVALGIMLIFMSGDVAT